MMINAHCFMDLIDYWSMFIPFQRTALTKHRSSMHGNKERTIHLNNNAHEGDRGGCRGKTKGPGIYSAVFKRNWHDDCLLLVRTDTRNAEFLMAQNTAFKLPLLE